MRVAVTALVGHPGQAQDHRTTIPPEDLSLAGGISVGPVAVELTLEGVVEGVLATGTLEFDLHRPCARCLTRVSERQRVDVVEMFVDPARRDPDDEIDPGYELVEGGTVIDLTTLLHDGVLIRQPVRILCNPDCAGLCVVCGADRNHNSCDCDATAPADPRWAVLADVKLDQSD